MLAALKNVRRQTVQTVLESVGAAEKTVDEEFDIHCHKFDSMVADMNECGAALSSALTKQKAMFSDCQELARVMAKIYQVNTEDQSWPNCPPRLEYGQVCMVFKEMWDKVHTVIRSSAAMVCAEDGLEPFRSTVTEVAPALDKERSDRNTLLKDYDAHRRRLKGLEQKRDAAEAQGKGGSASAADTIAEIQKFEAKVQRDLDAYTAQNNKTKQAIIAAKLRHDELMDTLLITVATTQAELFKRAASELEEVLSLLPQEKVAAVRANVQSYLTQGGVQVDVKQKSTLQKGLLLATGKAVPSDFRPNSTSSSAPAAAPSASPSAPPAPSNPFGDEDDSPASPPQAPASRPPSVAGSPQVVALFDHKAEAEDELDFKAGDMVEVLEKSDSGWWKGRCHGKEGLFPYNYVKSD